MGKSSPPPPPDYAGAAQAQGVANTQAAITQGHINNPNVVTPYGTQTVSWSGNDPTITQALSPEQQKLYEQSLTTQGLLGGLGQQGAQSLYGIVGQPVNYSGVPAAGDPQQIYQNAVDAAMYRPLQDYSRRQDTMNSDLAAAGIPTGSKAWNTQQDLLNRQLTDAQMQAGLTGAQIGNQFFNQQQAARQQGINEMLAQRSVPLNEITALLSGSQATNPFQAPGYAQNSQVQPAPVYGAVNALGNYNTDVYNAEQARNSNLMSGLFGLGGAGIMGYALSDRRLKRNIKRIGTHPLGIGIYEYDLFGRHKIGVMADEVQRVKPEAVITRFSGYQMVNYESL